MDRLSALATAAVAVVGTLGLLGCDDKPAGAPTSRTNGAKVATHQGATTAAFCDVKTDEARAPAFTWPALADKASPPTGKGWRWVNLWATWCKPCVDEMPRLLRWRDQLAKAGHPVELAFISVDESDADVAEFRKLHPDAPPSTRLADPEGRAPWLAAMGLDAGAPIPIHLFVSPSMKARCVRAGGVREQDYAVVEQVFAGE